MIYRENINSHVKNIWWGSGGEAYDFLYVGSFRVADSHCRIRFFQEIGNGLPDDIAAAKDDGSFTPYFDFGFFEEDHDAFRCAGDEIRFSATFGEFTDIEGLETIDVFKR